MDYSKYENSVYSGLSSAETYSVKQFHSEKNYENENKPKFSKKDEDLLRSRYVGENKEKYEKKSKHKKVDCKDRKSYSKKRKHFSEYKKHSRSRDDEYKSKMSSRRSKERSKYKRSHSNHKKNKYDKCSSHSNSRKRSFSKRKNAKDHKRHTDYRSRSRHSREIFHTYKHHHKLDNDLDKNITKHKIVKTSVNSDDFKFDLQKEKNKLVKHQTDEIISNQNNKSTNDNAKQSEYMKLSNTSFDVSQINKQFSNKVQLNTLLESNFEEKQKSAYISSHITPQNNFNVSLPNPIDLPDLKKPPPGFFPASQNSHFFQYQTSFIPQTFIQKNFMNQPALKPIIAQYSTNPNPEQSVNFIHSNNHLQPPFVTYPLIRNEIPSNPQLPPQTYQLQTNIHLQPPQFPISINNFHQPPPTSFNQTSNNIPVVNNGQSFSIKSSSQFTSHVSVTEHHPKTLLNKDISDQFPPPPPPPKSNTFTKQSNSNLDNSFLKNQMCNGQVTNDGIEIMNTSVVRLDSDVYSPYSSTSEGSVDDNFANNLFDEFIGVTSNISPNIEQNTNSSSVDTGQDDMKDELANEIIKNISDQPNLNHLVQKLKSENPPTKASENIKSDYLISLAKSLDLSSTLGIHMNDLKKVLETAKTTKKESNNKHHRSRHKSNSKSKGVKVSNI